MKRSGANTDMQLNLHHSFGQNQRKMHFSQPSFDAVSQSYLYDKKNAGLALGMALLFIAVLAIMGTAMLTVGMANQRMAQNISIAAFDRHYFAAESALNNAIPGIANYLRDSDIIGAHEGQISPLRTESILLDLGGPLGHFLHNLHWEATIALRPVDHEEGGLGLVQQHRQMLVPNPNPYGLPPQLTITTQGDIQTLVQCDEFVQRVTLITQEFLYEIFDSPYLDRYFAFDAFDGQMAFISRDVQIRINDFVRYQQAGLGNVTHLDVSIIFTARSGTVRLNDELRIAFEVWERSQMRPMIPGMPPGMDWFTDIVFPTNWGSSADLTMQRVQQGR